MNKLLEKILSCGKYGNILFSLSIFLLISIIILPIPSILMDFLFSISISLSILIFMNVIYIKKASDFNSFPSILLITTLMRLALNIASTRLILSQGHFGSYAAGNIIEAFGTFVMQGSVIIGIMVFIIIIIINYIVITKGSERIAEVSARFNLDAMPGKQMSIDYDLSAGIIADSEAKILREKLDQENNFFGAMDGASKFVRGDAIACIFIILINFIAGIFIGIFQKNLSFSDAVYTYTTLTIGDGLVAQIPALLISVASGLIITKSKVDKATYFSIVQQLFIYPGVILVSAVSLLIISIFPGMPFFPFFICSTILFVVFYFIKNFIIISNQKTKKLETEDKILFHNLKIKELSLNLGSNLLDLQNEIEKKIQVLRIQFAHTFGVIIPRLFIEVDNLINSNQYLIKVKSIQYSKGNIFPDKLMILDDAEEEEGISAIEPTFNTKVKWVNENLKEKYVDKGCTVVIPEDVILIHLNEILLENLSEFIDTNNIKNIINQLILSEKKFIESEVIPKVGLITIKQVLHNLLSEKISIKNLYFICEAIEETYDSTKDILSIIRYVREKMSLQISSKFSEDNIMHVIMLSPTRNTIIENVFSNNISNKYGDVFLNKDVRDFIYSLNNKYSDIYEKYSKIVFITSPIMRNFIQYIIERAKIDIGVISENEVHKKIKINIISQI